MNQKFVENLLKDKRFAEVKTGLSNYEIEYLPTGSLEIDVVTGLGGWPSGRICTMAGKESCGKSTTALWAIANAQKLGHVCAYIDAEFTFDPERAQQLGIDLNKLLLIRVPDFQTGADLTYELARSGEVRLIVFDSIAGSPIKEQNEGNVGQADIGRKAKILGNLMTKVTPPVALNKVWLLMVNQLRDGLDPYGPKFVMPGGHALVYHSSVILYMSGKKAEDGAGLDVTVKVNKNKLASPFKDTKFYLPFSGQPDVFRSIANIVTDAQYSDMLGIERAGAYYSFPKEIFGEENKFQGMAKTLDFLRENPDTCMKLQNHVLKTLTRKGDFNESRSDGEQS